MTLRPTLEHPVVMELIKVPSKFNRLWLRLPAEEDESVYGGGEQFTYFNMRGHDFPIWTTEQGETLCTY